MGSENHARIAGLVEKPTLPDSFLAIWPMPIQLIDCIDRHEYLNCADGVQHVRVVIRSSPKASVCMLAGHDKSNRVISWQCLRMAQ